MRSIRSPLDGIRSPFGRTQGGIRVSIGAGPFPGGTELTATVSGLSGGETVTYQWTDDGVNISGATLQTYTVTVGVDSVADGSAIRCVATVDGTPYTSNARTVSDSNWILATGSWSDTGEWDDTAAWNDAA